jgi:hypothetical protein
MGEVVDRCALRVHGLLAGQILGLQHHVALQVAPGIGELCGILGLGRDGLIIRRLIRARIELRQQIALAHSLALGEADFLQLAVDPSGHGHRVEGLHGPESLQVDGHVRLGHVGGVHRDWRRWSLRGGLGRLVEQAAPGAGEQHEQERGREHAAASIHG